MTKKYLVFHKDIVSPNRDVKYFANQKYAIIEEWDDMYVMKKYNPAFIDINGNRIEIDAIEKGLDGVVYDVIEIEFDL